MLIYGPHSDLENGGWGHFSGLWTAVARVLARSNLRVRSIWGLIVFMARIAYPNKSDFVGVSFS